VETRGRPTRFKNTHITCPNPDCGLYGQWKKGNIVSFGKYISKSHGKTRRFKCKECGITFVYHSGGMWEGLRAPGHKFYEAIKLLVKGAPISFVAEVIDVKTDTVRRWLKLAIGDYDTEYLKYIEAEGDISGLQHTRDKYDYLYKTFIGPCREIDVTVEEIDELRLAVENGDMRRRAWAWRKKHGDTARRLKGQSVSTIIYELAQKKDPDD